MSKAKPDAHRHSHLCGQGCCHEHHRGPTQEHAHHHECYHEHIHVCDNEDHPEHQYDNPQETEHAPTPEPGIFSESYELTLYEESSTLPIQKALTHWVGEILTWVKDNHGFVGHIKGFIQGTESFWFSSTGKTIQTKPSPGWSQAKD